MSELQQIRGRLERLHAELVGEGIEIDSSLAAQVEEELLHARFIKVHEGIRPPYGALIVPAGLTLEGMRASTGTLEETRKLVDGQTSLLVRTVTEPDRGDLAVGKFSDELSLLKLARDTKGVVVRREDDGTITITSEQGIWVNELYSWRQRPAARQRLMDISDEVQLETGFYELVAELLDFAFHRLSPMHIGATLVLPLQTGFDPLTFPLEADGYELPMSLNLQVPDDRELLVGYLRVVDGAVLLTAEGNVARTQVKLQTSKETSRKIGADRGMRHSSAKWFSFDNPEALVIVVSADGPVTMYSDGARVAVFDDAGIDSLPNRLNTVSAQAERLETSWELEACRGCDKQIQLRVVRLEGANQTIEVTCPVCKAELPGRQAVGLWLSPRKPWTEESRTL